MSRDRVYLHTQGGGKGSDDDQLRLSFSELSAGNGAGADPGGDSQALTADTALLAQRA